MEETLPTVEQTVVQLNAESLLQLCVSYINQNGKTMFADRLKQLKQSKPIKKKCRDKNYIRFTKKKKKRPAIKVEANEVSAVETSSAEDATAASENDHLEESTANSIDDITPQIKKELPEELSDSSVGRPRRKVAVPFYYPENVSTPSPETVIKKEVIKSNINISGKSTKAKPKSRLSDINVTTSMSLSKGAKAKASAIKMTSTPKQATVGAKKQIITTAEKKARAKVRINYSEELVDEALMYEEILLNNREREQQIIMDKCRMLASKKSEAPVVLKLKSGETHMQKVTRTPLATTIVPKPAIRTEPIPVVGSEITLLPIVRPEKKSAAANKTGMHITLDKIKKTLSTNPAKVYNFNSAVSIQLTSASSQSTPATSPPGLAIKNIQSLFDGSTDSSIRNIDCRFCSESFSNNKLLAMHQLMHLKLITHRVGQTQILPSKQRKVCWTGTR